VKRKIEKKVIQKKETTLNIGMEEKILILMKTTPGGMKPDDIGKILGVDSKLVSGTMEKLVTEGVVFKEGENYRAASVYST